MFHHHHHHHHLLLKYSFLPLLDRVRRVPNMKSLHVALNITQAADQATSYHPSHILPPPSYINDIDDGIISKIWKFADDTKICKNIKNERDVEILRNDLKQLYKWSEDWQMLFNLDKCVVIHMGNKKKKFYTN